jgi:hypothetical protein
VKEPMLYNSADFLAPVASVIIIAAGSNCKKHH